MDKLQAKDLENGPSSPAERPRMTAAQDKTSRDIRQANDGHMGAGEQRRIARADDRQGARIHRQRRAAPLK